MHVTPVKQHADAVMQGTLHTLTTTECSQRSTTMLQVYPDMGVAAMLKNQWPDVPFNFASLSDRKPVSEEDDLVVLAAPDPQSKAVF